MTAYITPEGKMYYHKKDVEKVLGCTFDLEADIPKVKPTFSFQALGLNTIPIWPESLPIDWRIGHRKVPDGKIHKIYVPPSLEKYFGNMEEVEAYLSGGTGNKLEGAPLRVMITDARPKATTRSDSVEQSPPLLIRTWWVS